MTVSIPYEFTLLSNNLGIGIIKFCVSIPYEFTLLSNAARLQHYLCSVSIPYEFTLLSNKHLLIAGRLEFLFPTNLHYSQTRLIDWLMDEAFLFPTNLHYSQTIQQLVSSRSCFYSLRIYTTLKHVRARSKKPLSFYSLRIYTTLKQAF